ncbi:hypothetical protein RO07_10220 [Pandoraea pulmonicola]|uniref:Filamentous hemagglutinin n=1 Tax=Pandoraea pulmonicola TaxID=93221 RepID=A0AAJ4ZC88_PANPU|nr:hypothetical protein RO07_10220 [Pandoraea pulmonicola]SUA90723.1 Uncharacterised protein [Pandoraea pulmonicola]
MLTAGDTAAFIATGDAASDKGNVNIVGSNVDAKDVLLQATNQVNLRHSTDTESSRSENESKSGSFGVSFGTGGLGVSASMSRANGDANSDSAFQNNTHINAGNTAVIVSGGDTNIVGANVNADKVIARVGGDLKVASVQDTSESAAHQQSVGGGLNLSMGGASGSFSTSHGNASGSYAGVAEQSGIQAGSGGFDVNVAGNTDLKGAYIASTADPSKNQLTTGTLTYSDIQNHSDYKANSFGVGGGFSVGNGGANERTTGPSSGKNTGGPSPMLPQSESGSERGTTRSGVSDGAITLTNGASQTQDLASLNRDTQDMSSLNQTVSRTPDLQKTLDGQSRLMGAATAAGEAVARDIGTYADKKAAEAKDLAKNTNDPALKAKYEQEAKDWSEGGDSRALMHAAGGAIVAGLGGGNALGGALGAGATSKLGGVLNQLSEDIRDSHPTGNADMDQALAQIVTTSVGTAVGAAAGGTSGAFTGYNVDRFNRQLHPDERKWAKDHAKDFAKFYAKKNELEITSEQAEKMLLANGYIRVDAKAASGGAGYDATAAQYLTENAGGLFVKDQYYNSPFMFGNKDGTPTPEQLALPGAVANPKVGLGIAGGLVTAGLAPGIIAGGTAGVSYAQDLFAAYKAAQAGYSLTTAAATGAAVTGSIYTGAAGAGALVDRYLNGTPLGDGFDQRFSLAGLAASSTFGAYNGMFTTSMFGWAGIPNSITNVATIPGAVIRGIGLALGQTIGRAGQAIATSGDSKKQ